MHSVAVLLVRKLQMPPSKFVEIYSELSIPPTYNFSLITNYKWSKAILRIPKGLIVGRFYFTWISNMNIYLLWVHLLNMHSGVGYHKVGHKRLRTLLFWLEISLSVVKAKFSLRTSFGLRYTDWIPSNQVWIFTKFDVPHIFQKMYSKFFKKLEYGFEYWKKSKLQPSRYSFKTPQILAQTIVNSFHSSFYFSLNNTHPFI